MLKTVREISRYAPQHNVLATGFLREFPSRTVFHCRSLYAGSTLGVDNFKTVREKIRSQFSSMTDRFREKMIEFSSDSSTNMIFTEDLKNMIHLAKNTPEDMDLVKKMLTKFNRQNKELQFGNYVFGPVVMRMFYSMGNIDVPLELIRNPDFKGFFDQVVTQQIMMDMLYEKGEYQQVLDLYTNCSKNESLRGHRHLVVLVMASCYKLNTPDALKYAMDLWSDLQKTGKEPMRKAATFIATLALNQKQPGVALEIISTVRQQSYMTVRNIKVLSLAQVHRYEEVIVSLKGLIEVQMTGFTMKQSISKEILDQIQDIVAQSNSKELLADIQRVIKFLNEHGHVTEKTLDELLCTEVTVTNVNSTRPERSVLAGSFRSSPRERQGGFTPRFSRPGLSDIN
ncbi:pentatricopeptide repeat-containing protein 2, mitochondrial-like [Phlebotomus argentipes]|uniref:pentatricopeptide repeat-containing protein 2, mitochondrial-like n=1 Tax=Phlebotomus argentipes TaxID=94469 RepID=UPI002892F16A|nr:pentatricopeptide repeat-containing protein 2, mitochondrial-like [Phlebotomus argentipes]